MERHWFPGGNTARGFHSFFHCVLPRDAARRVVILKGGPGVGKSTLMRRIAIRLMERRQRVEYLHCSSDPESLDGVVCGEIGFAMLDGTAPHILDPEVAGAVDSIVNLGVYLDEGALAARKKEIMAIQTEMRACFAHAYRYLASALPLWEDSASILSTLLDEQALMRAFDPWISSVTSFRGMTKPGAARSMFASAITPLGCVCHLESLAVPRVWRIVGASGRDGHRLLSFLRRAALARGMDVEAMHCPMQPERLEHLYIETLGLFITTENAYHRLDAKAERTLAFDEFWHRGPNSREMDALDRNGALFDELLSTAIVSLARAKALHDELEAEYIPRMDFGGAEKCFEEVCGEVERLL